MNELQTVNRKIILKRQAVKIINAEIRALRVRKNLLRMKAELEGQMKNNFDRQLSLEIDSLLTLIEGCDEKN